ncbi:MAG: indolepyruvate/phenylpyruvate decarboxylase [Gammaproteobacteria bacterium]|nr:MAG: indolepyruvate/phenylpyruvate decarboxylase [Gammaproteobacteria bacterium]
MKKNLAEQLLLGLKAYGVSEIFGIPGDFALPFFKVVEESQILPAYYMSHEPSVGFAADAATRYHGKPSVAAVTYGAGGLNMVNPIATAYAEKTPVVVISGGPGESEKVNGLLLHHQAKDLHSQINVYKEVTVDQVVLSDPKAAPEQIARVLANCIRYSRPVYIEIPRDQVFMPCRAVPRPPKRLWHADQDKVKACAKAILDKIACADNPIIIAGIEVKRFGVESEIAELSRRLDIPVVTTLMARGLFSESENIDYRGTYVGKGGHRNVFDLVTHSDLPILFGVLLNDTNFGLSADSIDFNHAIVSGDEGCSLGYFGFDGVPLPHLMKQLLAQCKAPKEKKIYDHTVYYEYGFSADEAICKPNDIAILLNDVFKEHGDMWLATDMGDCFFTTLDVRNTRLVAPAFYATMGYGVPAGFGLQAASGERPIILVGDGAFQMTGWEILNMPRYGLNPIILVFNNASWEMLRTFQPESAFNDLPLLDFKAIGDSLGGIGYRANNRAELKQSFEQALADKAHFHVIDIKIEKKVLSKTLGRFVSGIKTMREQPDEE